MSQLFDPNAYRLQKLGDFHSNIPDIVWPTSVWMLHQGGDILIYRNADAAKKISSAQHRMFHRAVTLTDGVDAPGTITVLACTGLPGIMDRQIAIYDHMHNDEKLRLAKDGEIGRFIADWWQARVGIR